MVVYPIVYDGLYTSPGGCLGFQPSTVPNAQRIHCLMIHKNCVLKMTVFQHFKQLRLRLIFWINPSFHLNSLQISNRIQTIQSIHVKPIQKVFPNRKLWMATTLRNFPPLPGPSGSWLLKLEIFGADSCVHERSKRSVMVTWAPINHI